MIMVFYSVEEDSLVKPDRSRQDTLSTSLFKAIPLINIHIVSDDSMDFVKVWVFPEQL